MTFSFGTAPTNKYGAIATDEKSSDYQKKLSALVNAYNAGQISQDEFNARRNEIQSAEFGTKSFDIGEFQDLLGRLEGSKMRQQRQKSVEGRRDIMSQGLASMMSNF